MDIGIIISSLQSHSALLPVMRAASFLGVLEFYLLVLPAVYWCFDRRLGLRLPLILMFSQGLNEALKAAFHLPRPCWVNPLARTFSGEASFGLPSAHAQNAVCVWGMIAGYSRKAWVSVAALLLIALIGISRLYLGVHFPVDVMAGWLIGALILAAFLLLDRPVSERLRDLSLPRQMAVSLLASLGLLAAYYLAVASLGDWQMPEAWVKNALDKGAVPTPLNPQGALTAAGMVWGIGLGAAVLQNRGGFDSLGPARERLLRYAIGMALLVLIWYGLGELGHGLALAQIYAFYYLRAFLAGAFVAGAAPLLFVKLGLADKA